MKITSSKPSIDFAAREIVSSVQTGTVTCTAGWSNCGSGFSVTIPTNGLYILKAGFTANSVGAGDCYFGIAVDAVIEVSSTRYHFSNDNSYTIREGMHCESIPVQLMAGDVITLQNDENSGAVLVYYSPGNVQGYISAELLEAYVPVVQQSITSWGSYALNITGTTTNPTKGGGTVVDNAQWRRVGDSMEITYNYSHTSGGGAGAGNYLFSIPTGYTIDTTIVNVTTNNGAKGNVGSASAYSSSGTAGGIGVVQVYNSTNLCLTMYDETNDHIYTVNGGGWGLFNTTCEYSFRCTIPIVEFQ